MNKGWIIVEKQTRQDKHEIQNTVGLLKITETKETRAYTIKGVIDPRNDKELSIQEARQEGILLTGEKYHICRYYSCLQLLYISCIFPYETRRNERSLT